MSKPIRSDSGTDRVIPGRQACTGVAAGHCAGTNAGVGIVISLITVCPLDVTTLETPVFRSAGTTPA
jgi:hypothetical protein